MRSRRARFLSVLLALSLLAAACGDDDGGGSDPAAGDQENSGDDSGAETGGEPGSDAAAEPNQDQAQDPPAEDPETVAAIGEPVPTPDPTLTDPPDEGDLFYQGVGFDLGLLGYQQREYFMSGTARSFVPADGTDLTSDGAWTIEPADEAEWADYTSRIVVVTPTDPADFNGTVIMEWFNVSGGLDAAPNFTMSHVEQLRSGYAYVGVSAQFRGIEPSPGTIDIGFPIFLKGVNPARYESLDHPGDTFSYDIFNQAAQAVRNPTDVDPLGGLEVEHMIATGESQSAFRLTTYVNAIDPLAQLFDGFLIHSRGGGSAALSQDPQPAIETPEQVFVRDDVRVPVLTFQTDSDLLLLGWVPDRQDDAENFVLWEVAGTAHGDVYSIALDVGPADLGDDPSIAEVVEVASPIPGIMDCGGPINSGPQHYVMNAAVHALARWVGEGVRPTEADRMQVVEAEIDPDAPDDGRRQATHETVTDEHGNVLGGVRTAWVDVPVATLTGDPVEGDSFCGLFGSTTLFDEAKLADLYPDKIAYLDAMTESIVQSVTDGFLLEADAELILENAASNAIGT